MSKIDIRECTLDDAKQIKKICEDTFLETFATTNSPEDMKVFLKKNFNRKQIEDELGQKDSYYYVVYVNDELAGYMKLNTGSAQTEQGHPDALEVQRIYILVKFKGNGIGRQLIKLSMDIAKREEKHYVWLGVWEYNYPAIKFYEKQGFERFDKHTFMVGNDAQIDHLMKRMVI